MASSSPFQIEDQTDEDFFDKLVEDELSVERSNSDSKNMQEISSLSLDDVATTMEDSGVAHLNSETKDRENSYNSQSYENGIFDSQESASVNQAMMSGDSTASATEVTKPSQNDREWTVSSVKEAQWSAFNLHFQQVDEDENKAFLGFLAESVDVPSNEPKSNAEPSPSFIGNQDDDLSTNISSSGALDVSSANEQNPDWNDVQYWQNIYPGWKYDATTGQWYQVDCYDVSDSSQFGTLSTGSTDAKETFEDKVRDAGTIQGSLHMQQTSKSMLETIEEDSTFTNVSSWSLGSQWSTGYPSNMVFDPQYPEWYYDTHAQQWYTLQSYINATQNSSVAHEQVSQDMTTSPGLSGKVYNVSDGILVSEEKATQDQETPGFGEDQDAFTSTHAQPNMWQPDQVGKSGQFEDFSGYQQIGSVLGSAVHVGSNMNQQIGLKTFEPTSSYSYSSTNGFVQSHILNTVEDTYQFNSQKLEPSLHSNLLNSYYGNQNIANYSQQQFLGANNPYSQFSHSSNEGRSTDGRPVHALVAFGFGGKLIVMKDPTCLERNSSLRNEGDPAGEVSILNLSEAVKDKYNDSGFINGRHLDYFSSLCEQSFPGPLVGGNAAAKDVNKWIDERIKNYEASMVNFQIGRHLHLLLSLLKISCQNYGKLRSPFGSDRSAEETDGPEMAVTKLFASVKKNLSLYGEYGLASPCLQNPLSEERIRRAAMEVQNLLLSGRRKEALQCAQEGQLWGPALVLADQLGNQFYVDTVKKMAHDQFVPGSPLRTLCLLIAGQPADVFSASSSSTSLSYGGNTSQLTAEVQGSRILDDWEENMAIITANKTKDDELVMIHLGDCLWRERAEVIAAHTCYLVAEVKFEPYFESARLCLLTADHWRYPRTYASPHAIQRTELYEYSKVLGNSQFILVTFQPYKLIYAHMLAEVGKVSESLRYCQASLKLLKNCARTPEVEMCKSLFSSFEERLRMHQQGGYSTNLAPTKLVGKLITSIDRGIHRIIGAPAAPLPPMPQGSVNDREPYSAAPKVANSQSTMAMSSLVSSASVETMNQLMGDGSRKIMHNRSISEPDFGRSPKKDAAQNKESSGGTRFGQIGSQLLQKTMGWVSKSHRQAKLGEQNKFYYDEKLKMWVEEGTKPSAEEPVIAPPPKEASFQNGMPDYNLNNNAPPAKSYSFIKGSDTTTPFISSEYSSAIPPIPPRQNQFSARAKLGVRSRYVDTFNSGHTTSTSSFQLPSVTSANSLPMAGATFFVPTAPATSDKHINHTVGEGDYKVTEQEEASTSMLGEPPYPPPSSSLSSSMQRFPSMNKIAPSGFKGPRASYGYERARAASWGGGTDVSTTLMSEVNFPGNGHEVASFLPNNTSHDHSNSRLPPYNGVATEDELQEVEL